MKNSVIHIPRQDPGMLHHVYGIRQAVFVDDLGFPPEDRMVYNEWDALSNHYLLNVSEVPGGTVSVIDLTGLTDIVKAHGLDPSLKIAKVTKLAILSQFRGVRGIKDLLHPVFEEMHGYDFIVAHVGPPSNDLSNDYLMQMGEKYHRIFGGELISEMKIDGTPMLVYGVDLRKNDFKKLF